ncbi:MAG: hypothetical protein JRH15_19665 [Deltaproteobacteria bacterium]|nr:hypothetical protein [Deltaproteobacteria bacterium]
MSWEKAIEELKYRKNLAKQMGGPENVSRQHKKGKLTIRERIQLLADGGSFREWNALAGEGIYTEGKLTGFIPKPSVHGTCLLNGRKVIVTGGDFTVRGGSGAILMEGLGSESAPSEKALELLIPYIRLLDAAGGSVKSFENIGRTYLPDGNIYTAPEVKLLSTVPVVSALLGPVAGLPAIGACLGHFNVMVKNISQVFAGGPPVVKAALSTEICKEELGGDQVHVYQSGVVDNLAQTEEEAFNIIRKFLGYLPDNVWEIPPRVELDNPPDLHKKDLLSIIPESRRKAYDPYAILYNVLDSDSFFEISPFYGRSRITGMARVNGYPAGVMINNTLHLGGATDVAAGEKVMRLIQLCDTFHLPLISFADEPGFMVGPDSEQRGIERAGARLVWTVCSSRVPWITFVIGKLYGVAGQCHHRPTGMFQRYAWPSGRWGSMHIAGGVDAAYRREIETAAEPDKKRQEIENRLKALASPYRTAEKSGTEIIDPRDTRRLLSEFMDDAQRVLKRQIGAPVVPYRP